MSRRLIWPNVARVQTELADAGRHQVSASPATAGEAAEIIAALKCHRATLGAALRGMCSPYMHDGKICIFTDLPPALKERLRVAAAALEDAGL